MPEVAGMEAWWLRLLALVFGAAWGSFFNVAIYRWPREMSVVSPASHCPACGAPVRAWYNVPVLGYLLLRGRARCCGAQLSARYLLVEVIGAVVALAIVERFVVNASGGASVANLLSAFIYFCFAGGLIIATFVDLDCMQIPDEVTLPGAALGLATVSLRAEPGATAAAVGAGLGFLIIQGLFVWGYELAFGRRGMGEGDSKLLLMVGAFVG